MDALMTRYRLYNAVRSLLLSAGAIAKFRADVNDGNNKQEIL